MFEKEKHSTNYFHSIVPSFEIVSSFLNRLILKGSINYWIYQWIWHSKKENARLKVFTHWFVDIRKHKKQHHGIIRKPTNDDWKKKIVMKFNLFSTRINSTLTSNYNHNRYPQRSHFRLVNQFLSIWITPSHVIEMRARRRVTRFEFEHSLATYFDMIHNILF